MDAVSELFSSVDSTYLHVYITVLRWLAPILAGLLLFRCLKPLLTFRREPEIWAWLCMEGGKKIPVMHWENVIGRHKRSDIVIDFPTVSRNHAVLTRYGDGSWAIWDTDSKSGVLVNGVPETICALHPGDEITIGGVALVFQPISAKQEKRLAQLRTHGGAIPDSFANLMLLTVFQVVTCLAFLLSGGPYLSSVLLGFCGILAAEWLLMLFYFIIRRTAFEVETLAFFLCTMGMAAIATVCPQEAGKQLIAMLLGIALFLAIGFTIRDLRRVSVLRRVAAVAGAVLLLLTLVFGTSYRGAKNWIIIGGISLQLSELVKVCFVLVGASTMDRILNRRNLIGFIAYSVMLCGFLALMNDFGTVLIFFLSFLVIAFMRSGSIGTIGLACTSAGFAGVLALNVAPHTLRRFRTWRNIWADPYGAGYQQTRCLMCVASGGLLGLGPGQGWMKNLFAADSDVVIATLSEEWGLILAVMMVLSVLGLAVFALRSCAVARSSFYAIGGCTAAAILLVQVMLNALGTVDVLPFTGVTFPFVSNGGSSMMGAWGLLAFIKATDTRQNASFAVSVQKSGGEEDA